MKDLISHAATLKDEEVNWENIIKQYIAFPSDVEESFQKYYDLAQSWGSCACGQLPHILKRIDGEPEDRDLRNWGSEFSTAFIERDFPLALRFLKRIQIKVASVIAEQQYIAELAVLALEEELTEAKEEQKRIQSKLTEAKKTLKLY